MELLPVFALGSILYGLTEIMWRGWTHWTMLLCGGLCFTLMYLVSGSELSLFKKWLLSTCIITTVEFMAGCIVNLRLHWQIWDYSSMPFNLLGQICPQFILMWFALSIPGMALCTLLHRLFTAAK